MKGYSNWKHQHSKYSQIVSQLKNISDLKCILPLMEKKIAYILYFSLKRN